MGVPEIEARWKELEEKRLSGTLNKEESRFFKKWIKAVGLVERNPRHPSLSSHEIEPLTRRYGERVWQSYLENNTPAAGRIFLGLRAGATGDHHHRSRTAPGRSKAWGVRPHSSLGSAASRGVAAAERSESFRRRYRIRMDVRDLC
jgi:hypothetical protein